jgi:hypothetical protein
VTGQSAPDALPLGQAIRLSASDGTHRSADWRVWTSRNADDVYAAARLTGGEIKVSLHQSGSWQHGFTADGNAAGSLPQDQSRHFRIWQRPAEITPGWTRAVQIILPDAALQARPSSGTPRKPVTEFVAAGAGDATIAELWLESAASPAPPPLAGYQLAGRLSQPGGGTAWVVGRRMTLPWDPCERFSQLVDSARAAAIGLRPDWCGDPPLSICLHDPASQDGSLILCELTVAR